MTETNPKAPTIDGLCIIGTLTEVEPVRRKTDGEIIEGFAKAKFKTTRGEIRVDLKNAIKVMTGDIMLPAYDKLRHGQNKRWLVTIGLDRSGDNRQYLNYVALDAVAIDN